jgi:hypothetical protein
VERNQFAAKKVLPWRNAGRNRDGLLALVGDQTVHTPLGAVEGIFSDLCRLVYQIGVNSGRGEKTHLKPAIPDTAVCLRVRHFLQVCHNGAFVAGIDDIVGTGLQRVAPCQSCGRAGLHCNDGVCLCGWVWAAVADNVVRGHVLDGLGAC